MSVALALTRGFRPALASLSLLGLVGCHWLAGHPDAELNGGFAWHPAPLSPPLAELDPSPSPRDAAAGVRDPDPRRRIWVRVRADEAAGSRVPVLSSRVRHELGELGWLVVEDRSRASVWLDLQVRYWGVNPVGDLGVSAYAKLEDSQRPDLLGVKEEVQRREINPRIILTPSAFVISRMVADVVEFDLIVDTHLKQGSQLEEKQTLVVWVRRIELGEQEAAIAISDRVLEALRGVFQ